MKVNKSQLKSHSINRISCEGKLFPTNSGHVFLVKRYVNNSKVVGNFIGSPAVVITTFNSLKKGMIKHPTDKKLLLEGRLFESKCYGEFFIKNYNNSTDVLVEFVNTRSNTKTTLKACREGYVKDYESPSVYGVGFIGHGEYRLSKKGNSIVDKAYKKWSSMFKRVYASDHIVEHPSYKNCVVDHLWLNFQNFAKWYIVQEREGLELDKDLLVKGNKLYSPFTCTLLPKEINTTLTKNDKRRSSCGIGLSKRENDNYRSNSKKGKTYNNPMDAYTEYKKCKEDRLKLLAEKYKDVITKEAYEALYLYKVEEID